MDGYYCEGAMVVVEGYSGEAAFEVHTIGMVPAEPASVTRSLQSHPDPLSDTRKEIESPDTLRRIMDQQSYSHFLFFSEMHLDNAALMECFGEILEEHSSDPPAVIVLMGRFLSVVPAEGPRAFDAYEAAFTRLGNLIGSFKNIREQTRFVLIPCQSDAFYPNILPRPALPADLFEGLREQGIDFIPASNPCHIKCFTRDIVVMRLDATSLLDRSRIPAIPQPEHDIDVGQTLLDQGQLCPIPLGIQPVQWNMAHALSLYPVPDMLCVGDKAAASANLHAGCQFTNPGEFFRSGLVYIQYYPSSNRTDFNKLRR
jgi:DNA polymerase epsilon subunit 2